MKKILLALCLLVLNNLQAEKGNSTQKAFEEAKQRPLYVVLDQENEDYLAKLQKKGNTKELENYRTLIANTNAYLKSAVEDYIDMFPSVKYITLPELQKMKKKDIENVNVLLRTFPMQLGRSPNAKYSSVTGQSSSGAAWSESRLENFEMDPNNTTDLPIIEFRTKYDDDMMPIFSQYLNQLFCSKGEVYFAVRQFKKMFNGILAGDYENAIKTGGQDIADGLKTKTLLINQADLSAGLTAQDIKSVYPYPFRVVSAAEFNTALMGSSDETLILLPISFQAGPMFMGRTHTIYDSSTEHVYWPNPKKASGPIEKKHFGYYLEAKK